MDFDDCDDLITCETDKQSSSQKSLLKQELILKCPDLAQLGKIKSLRKRYITLKGLVQSGKTNFIISAASLFLLYGFSSVIILRNNKADQEQIFERLHKFEDKMKDQIKRQFFSICKTSTQSIVMDTDTPRIYLTLGNNSSTSKIMQKIQETNTPYVLFIDEVDFVDSGEGTRKNEYIPYLKQNAHCVFGVSATVMDPIGKEQVYASDIILLSVPKEYKGIPSIQVEPIVEVATYTGKTSANLFKTDKGLLKFVREFSEKKAFVVASGFVHPQICLVNICRTKEPTILAQTKLSEKYPEMLIVVYNGDGITYSFRGTQNQFKGTISAFLQTVKDRYNRFIKKFSDVKQREKLPPNILIFSGDLAGRGISFTSSDFLWHLTSMRLLVAPNCDEPELIQRVRLCGIYHDDIPLTLHSTPAILEDIRKAYYRQEEIICFLKQKQHEKAEEFCKELIESLDINNEKFTKRSSVKDRSGTSYSFNQVNHKCGWDIDVYENAQLPPVQAYTLYGMKAPTEEEREKMISENIKEKDESEEEEEDDEDVNVIVYASISNPKYIVTFLKTKK